MGHQDRYPGAGAAGPGAEGNSGIFVGGNNTGAIASGHARATQVTYRSDDNALEMIDRLLRKLEAEAGALEGEQAEDVVDEVHQLHTEIHRRRPNAESIRSTLSRLTAAAGSTATLLATADQIKDLIGTLVH
jgi:hypothetical protein